MFSVLYRIYILKLSYMKVEGGTIVGARNEAAQWSK